MARRDAALGLRQDHLGRTAATELDRGAGAGVGRAQADRQRRARGGAVGADPVDLTQGDPGASQRLARSHHHAARGGLEPYHVKRRPAAQPQAASLADGVVNDAAVAAEDLAVEPDDVAGLRGAGPQPLDGPAIPALGHEADVLAVGLGRDRQGEACGELSGLGLGQAAQRKAQHRKLIGGGREEEVALVAGTLGGAVELGPVAARQAPHVVAGGQRLGPKLAGEPQEIAELHRLIAAHAGDRRLAAEVAADEVLDHRFAEPRFVIEDVVGDVEPRRHRAGIVDVGAGATRAGPPHRAAVIVELQRDAEDVVALVLEERRHHRGIHAARHCHDHPAGTRRASEVEAVARFGHGSIIAQAVKGSRTRMVSSRSGLVDRSVTGASISSSMRLTYLTAVAGKSAQLRAPRVLSVHPSTVS